jgi:predicted RNA-binding protein with PUA-like domain
VGLGREVADTVHYHIGKEGAIVGIVKVIVKAHPDSTNFAWRAVDVESGALA